MTNKEAIEILTNVKSTPQITWTNGADVAFDLAIKALENEKPQSEWIPVSVQEPDVGRIYLVTGKNVNGYIGIDIARRISDNIWTFGGEELPGTEIIAWMPLPEPYKEVENE